MATDIFLFGGYLWLDCNCKDGWNVYNLEWIYVGYIFGDVRFLWISIKNAVINGMAFKIKTIRFLSVEKENEEQERQQMTRSHFRLLAFLPNFCFPFAILFYCYCWIITLFQKLNKTMKEIIDWWVVPEYVIHKIIKSQHRILLFVSNSSSRHFGNMNYAYYVKLCGLWTY